MIDFLRSKTRVFFQDHASIANYFCHFLFVFRPQVCLTINNYISCNLLFCSIFELCGAFKRLFFFLKNIENVNSEVTILLGYSKSRDGRIIGPGGATGQWLSQFFFYFNIIIYMCTNLAIFFYKIIFCFSQTISLILLSLVLYSRTFL